MKNKIIYKPAISEYQKIMYAVMRIMVECITNGIEVIDLFPAINSNDEYGIFYHNVHGGKIFWTYDQLQDLYIRKNNEFKRFKR